MSKQLPWLGGWVVGYLDQMKINLISAFNKVAVKVAVPAELWNEAEGQADILRQT